MIAAIYARRSKDQKKYDEEARSTTRQIANARAFAKVQGWTVDARYIYCDEGGSGRKGTAHLKARSKLLTAIHEGERAPFDVLIVRDESRFSRRDGADVFTELKAIDRRKVQVWYYAEGRRFVADGGFGQNVATFSNFEHAAEYARHTGKLVRAAHVELAREGLVTGSAAYGYRNVEVRAKDDEGVERRRGVTRVVFEPEAAVVRRIYRLYVGGMGFSRIARTLAADGVASPHAKQSTTKNKGWNATTIAFILRRPIYRGRVVWNRTRKVEDALGRVVLQRLPESEHVTVERPELRIISDEDVAAVDRRLTIVRAHYHSVAGKRPYRREDTPKYLLSGFIRCQCGSGMHIRLHKRAHGPRAGFYNCTRRYGQGDDLCQHKEHWEMAELDRAVLDAMLGTLSTSDVDAIIGYARDAYADVTKGSKVTELEQELDKLRRADARLLKLVLDDETLDDALVEQRRKLKTRQASVERELVASRKVVGLAPVWRTVEKVMRKGMSDWKARLQGDVPTARQALSALLDGPVVLSPIVERGKRAVRFSGRMSLPQLFSGVAGLELVMNDATTSRPAIDYTPGFTGVFRSQRAA